jgi:hypothetical protein
MTPLVKRLAETLQPVLREKLNDLTRCHHLLTPMVNQWTMTGTYDKLRRIEEMNHRYCFCRRIGAESHATRFDASMATIGT